MEVLGYIVAVLIGISLGLIGSGGSILTVPVLVYLFKVEPVLATTYSLCIVGLSSIAGVISKIRQKLLVTKVILVFGIPSMLGVIFSRKFILPSIPKEFHLWNGYMMSKNNFVMLFFAMLMLAAALSIILGKKNKSENENIAPHFGLLLGLAGLAEGTVTGIVGAGGGFLIIPALVLLARLPMKNAIASSLFIITVKSLIGFVGDLTHTTIDFKLLVSIVILATGGILIGNYLNNKMDGTKLKKGFGWFVFIMSIIIFIEQIASALGKV